jgi:hypothetical protein
MTKIICCDFYCFKEPDDRIERPTECGDGHCDRETASEQNDGTERVHRFSSATKHKVYQSQDADHQQHQLRKSERLRVPLHVCRGSPQNHSTSVAGPVGSAVKIAAVQSCSK